MTKIAETSGLILLWTDNSVYQSDNARAHLAKLDLSASISLRDKCEEGFDLCSSIIKNRKFGVLRMSADLIPQQAIEQIVIAGAGLDAMGIELAQLYPSCSIYELDNDNMELKTELTHHIDMHCLNVDLGDAEATITVLEKAGWTKDKNTLLILEGITYYLPMNTLRDIRAILNPKSVIADILKCDDMTEEAKEKGDYIFHIIETTCGLPPSTRYNVRTLADTLQMNMQTHWSMDKLEKERTGLTDVFKNAQDAPIDMASYIRI